MSVFKPSCVVVALGMILSLAGPATCVAGPFDCLFPSTTAPPTTVPRVTMMPVAMSAGACDPCGQQVTMVPETKRRWTYSRIPKTTYKPVTSCDPCTGCPVTTYRPQTSYSLLPWLHRQTYTIYKPVATQMAAYSSYATSACNPCATSTCSPCGGGVSSSYVSGSSGCSTCTSGAPISSASDSASRAPQLPADSGYSSQKTYDPEDGSSQRSGYPSQQNGSTEEAPQPKPDSVNPRGTSTELPELNGPQGRTVARPIQRPSEVRQVSWEVEPARRAPVRPVTTPKLDVSGWHAVTR